MGGVVITPKTHSKATEVFTAQLGGAVGLAWGHCRVTGNRVFTQNASDKSRIVFNMLGRGQWDGVDRLWINRKLVDPTDNSIFHFHDGNDGTLGSGMAAVSLGGDQLVDTFYNQLPSSVDHVTFSGMAYMALHYPADPGAPTANFEFLGDFRTRKVRIFDAAGNQTAYQFSTNPAWCILDAIILLVLKRDALANAALSASEKTKIDFASFAAAAAYYDFIIPNGNKRFEMNVAYPQKTDVGSVLEHMLMLCRSYILEVGGVIFLYADQPKVSQFTLTLDQVVPGSLQEDKTNLRGAPNRIVGHYNDLNIAISATIAAGGITRSGSTVTVTTVDTTQPFLKGDTLTIQGCDDPLYNGDHLVVSTPAPNQFTFTQASGASPSGNGIVGANESLFGLRAPLVDHEAHQNAVGALGFDLARVPSIRQADIDFGNNTGQCVRRLLVYQLYRQLGFDQTPWIAPIEVRVKVWIDSVDANNNALIERVCGDVITIDATVNESFTGDYEIIEMQMNTWGEPDNQAPFATVDLYLKLVVPQAFTDNPDDCPSISGGSGSGGLHPFGGPANASYVVNKSANLSAADAGTSETITVPAFSVRVAGITVDPQYTGGSIVNAAYNTLYYVYCDDPDLRGGSPLLGATTDRETALYTAGRIYIDAIQTGLAGGSSTSGNGWGGAGPRLSA